MRRKLILSGTRWGVVALAILVLSYGPYSAGSGFADAGAGEPSGCPVVEPCDTLGDINCDARIDGTDLGLLIGLIFCDVCGPCGQADVNGDGVISVADVPALIALITPQPTATPTVTPTDTVSPTSTVTPSATETGTETPTETPTIRPDECCACPGEPELCAAPADGTCPTGCSEVRNAACLPNEGCATHTPTETPTVTQTPTETGTPTDTPTATATIAPERDCCACPDEPDLCAVPAQGACPAGCSEVREAVCVPAEGCALFTPTPTRTATATVTPTRPPRTPTFTPLDYPHVDP